MAAYSVLRSKTATLVAATEDTVTLTASLSTIRVTNFSTTARISVRMDGTAATVDGDNTVPVPPDSTITLLASEYLLASDQVVSLISAGTPDYCVHAYQ